MKKYMLLLVSSALLIACGSDTKTENTETAIAVETVVQLSDAQLKNMTLQTGKLEKKSISSILKVNGIIDVPPQNMVSISVPLGGFLKSTKLLPGMHIAKGEIIAIMEDQQYIQLQQDYLTTAANLKYAEADFNRQKELNQSKATSDKAFQQAEADYLNQKITLKSLNEKLRLIGINPEKLNENSISRSVSIPSPIDGYVSAVNVNIGKYVNPTDVLFELVNPEDIHLGLTVFEKDLDKLFIGQKVMAYTNHNADKKYPCEIILIGKDLSDERSVEVHCHFEQYDKSLIPGMYMNADLEVKSNDALVLPDDAIVRFENKEYVFLVKDNNTFEMTEVKIGDSENGFTAVSSSTKLTEQLVVTKGAYTLLMKIKNKEE
ncbi:MAG: efflux RND transporter periplasmic adaptor subunit [Bacteroidetes bacterium]|nr:efflux RND transporter periplasmic adaptor subunit [Bacteroidota bacterium]